MHKTLSTLGLTLVFLAVMDFAVAGVLAMAERQGRLGGLVRYFEFGRSVPGKLEVWEANPGIPGNLYNVAWIGAGVDLSAAEFAAEAPDEGPAVRSYGMSFVNNILEQAQALDSSLRIDGHAGPGAPPNFTYAFFLDDRGNRREGDIAVLGILSSSVAAMAALSNQTWVFEQPAPFTYPVFRPDDDGGLTRISPIVTSAAQHRALDRDRDLARAWAGQLSREDAFHSVVTHGATFLDRSPFARLVRRAMAQGHIERHERRIIDDESYPYVEVLQRMIVSFADLARGDGQRPIVMLIQTGDPRDPDLLQIAGPLLERNGIPYLATADHVDLRNPAAFLPDGHYAPEIDRRFGQVFLDLIEAALLDVTKN